MLTKAEKRRQQKKKAIERRIRHSANIRRNNHTEPKYRLDILLEGTWRIGIKAFKSMEYVEEYKEDTERRRSLGEEIVPGRVIDTRTGEAILTIDGSSAKPMKGVLPDKLAESESAKKAELPEKVPEKAAKKGLLGFFRKS